MRSSSSGRRTNRKTTEQAIGPAGSRLRNWHKVAIFRNDKNAKYGHFTAVSSVNRAGMWLAMGLAMQRSTFASILAGIGVSFSLFVPRAAEACWTCTTDTECPTGFTCDANTGCMPTVDCNADSDCGAGMRCVTETATECASPVAQNGTSTADSTCHTVNSCAPIWQAGCGSDSDCGDGFTCVQNGSLCNSTGCQTLAQCQPKQQDVSCNTDSDCPSCWSCLDASDSGESCVNPGGTAGGVNGTVAAPPDPADASPSASTADAGTLVLGGPGKTYSGSSSSGSSSSDPKVCRPPYWGLSVNYAGPPPSAPVNSSSSNLCPNIEATRSGYTGLDPKSGGSASSGGCSIGSTQGNNDSAPLWTLGAALAGLAVISRRKRTSEKSSR